MTRTTPPNPRTHAGLIALLVCGLPLWVSLSGCRQQEPENSEPSRAQTGHSGLDPADTPTTTPDVAVLTVVEGLRDNQPQALWHFLPTRYQADINTLVQDFARDMDAEVWSEAVETLRMLASLLHDKKDMLLQSPDLATPLPGTRVDTAALADRWDTVVGALEILADSSLGDLTALRKFDGQHFLETSGSELLQRLLTESDRNRLAEVKVRVLSMQGDRADVELTDFLGTTTQRTFVRVDGKWIPETLAASWDDGLQSLRNALNQLPAAVQQRKPMVLDMFDQIQAGLQEAQQAQTPQELVQALRPVANVFGGAAVDEETAAGLDLPADRVVTIEMTEAIDETQRDQISSRLMSLVDTPSAARSAVDLSEDRITFTLGPVDDIAAFAEKLDFLEVRSVDAGLRQILARPGQ